MSAISTGSIRASMTRRPRRYVTRPAICLDRLTVRVDGKIQYELNNPFRNGTTHILFSPVDFLSKLAALVPRPRHNLVRYHGVFVRGGLPYNAKLRKLIVPKSTKIVKGKVASRTHKSIEEAASQKELIAPLSWAQRLKRVCNMMGPPSDYPMPLVWRNYASHRRHH
jgi:hypothetical protein